jgi:hypothetical protein
VNTSTATDVNIPRVSLSQLQAGDTTFAIGYPRPDGTLSAMAVLSEGPGRVDITRVAIKGCSPASIDNAITTALVSG